MPRFHRSARQRAAAPPPAEAPDVACPFLARSITPGATHICLSSEDPLAVSRRYVDSYCLTADHARCSLFLAAYRASGEAPEPEPALQGVRLDVLGTGSQAPTTEPAADRSPGGGSDMVVDQEPGTEPDAVRVTPVQPDREPEVEGESGARGATMVAREPEPTWPTDVRARATAQAEALAGLTQSLQGRAAENHRTLTSLTARLGRLETGFRPGGSEGDPVARLRAYPDDTTLEAVFDAVRAVHENPNRLSGYIGVTSNARVLLEVVNTLLAFLPTETHGPQGE